MPELIAGGVNFHFALAPPQPGRRRPVVVFLHGAGANHTVWLAQMRDLRGRAWTVIPDLPGHGRSDEIPGLTVDEYASALVPFLEGILASIPAADRSGLVLAGHSMGGGIALKVALAAPSLLSGLVLVGSGAKLAVSPEILDGLVAQPSETRALLARWSFAKDADPDLILRTVRDLAGTPVERMLADFRACNVFDVRSELPRIATPALVVCGSEDWMTPPKHSEYLRDNLPRATLRIIERAGHGVMVEQAAAVSAAIDEFLVSLD